MVALAQARLAGAASADGPQSKMPYPPVDEDDGDGEKGEVVPPFVRPLAAGLPLLAAVGVGGVLPPCFRLVAAVGVVGLVVGNESGVNEGGSAIAAVPAPLPPLAFAFPLGPALALVFAAGPVASGRIRGERPR